LGDPEEKASGSATIEISGLHSLTPKKDEAKAHARDNAWFRQSSRYALYNSCHGRSLGVDFATIGDVGLVDHFGALLFGRIRRNCAWRSV